MSGIKNLLKSKINHPKKVIVHCAATPDSLPRGFTAADVDKWHKERGWRGIGYHRFIRGDGEIEQGRPDSEIGAHAKGHNMDSLGICYDGSYLPTLPQVLSLVILFREFRMKYGIDWADWHGHYEFANKDCPGFRIEVLRDILKKID
jgi:N-acetylmuramoyl-L-alanine amidase